MQLRCPYPEARELPWFGRVVEPDEVVDIPDEYAENFLAAGWKPPSEPVVWPPEPPTPPADEVPPDPDPAAPPTTSPQASAEQPPEPITDEGQDDAPASASPTTTTKKTR